MEIGQAFKPRRIEMGQGNAPIAGGIWFGRKVAMIGKVVGTMRMIMATVSMRQPA